MSTESREFNFYTSRHREDPPKPSERRVVGEGDGSLAEKEANVEGQAEQEGASANSSPVSSRNTSPRTSLYLSDPPSSMEGLLMAASSVHKGNWLFYVLLSRQIPGVYFLVIDCVEKKQQVPKRSNYISKQIQQTTVFRFFQTKH